MQRTVISAQRSSAESPSADAGFSSERTLQADDVPPQATSAWGSFRAYSGSKGGLYEDPPKILGYAAAHVDKSPFALGSRRALKPH